MHSGIHTWIVYILYISSIFYQLIMGEVARNTCKSTILPLYITNCIGYSAEQYSLFVIRRKSVKRMGNSACYRPEFGIRRIRHRTYSLWPGFTVRPNRHNLLPMDRKFPAPMCFKQCRQLHTPRCREETRYRDGWGS